MIKKELCYFTATTDITYNNSNPLPHNKWYWRFYTLLAQALCTWILFPPFWKKFSSENFSKLMFWLLIYPFITFLLGVFKDLCHHEGPLGFGLSAIDTGPLVGWFWSFHAMFWHKEKYRKVSAVSYMDRWSFLLDVQLWVMSRSLPNNQSLFSLKSFAAIAVKLKLYDVTRLKSWFSPIKHVFTFPNNTLQVKSQ